MLFEIKGEGSAGISDYANAAELAINQINARGGVGGKPIETKRLAVNGLDPQKAGSDFLQMVDWKPDLIVGFPSSTIEAVVPQITRAQIPVLTPVQEEEIGHGGRFGSDYLWMVPPVGSSLPVQAVDFLTKDLGKKSIAVLGTNESFGKGSSENTKAELKQVNLQPQSEQLISTTATDLTSQVLQMKGADAATTWIYPNTLGVLSRQLQQNGISIPLITQSAMELAVNGGVVKPSEYPGGVYAVEACSPGAAAPDSKLGAFDKAYRDAYKAPSFSGALSAYDGVYIAAAAAEKAGSLDAKNINKALATVTYSGACGEYRADGAHVLGHDVSVVKFNADGTSAVVKTAKNPPLEKGKN